uniref:Methyltransferase n=1 Tax=Steinernema glaseri TaxID=37863 RepID=A0A1I7Y1N2_9BILA
MRILVNDCPTRGRPQDVTPKKLDKEAFSVK